MIEKLPLLSTIVLGALHALEPGHGKSLIALHSSQHNKWKESAMMLVSLLVSHFSLIAIISLVIYKFESKIPIHALGILFPIIVIGYGIFLLIKSNHKKKDYIACSCGHESKPSESKPLVVGMMAGLSPCPSVFAPLAVGITSGNIGGIFSFLGAYIFGVMLVFLVLLVGISLLRKQTQSWFNQLNKAVNPHLFSGTILIGIGLIYLGLFLYRGH